MASRSTRRRGGIASITTIALVAFAAGAALAADPQSLFEPGAGAVISGATPSVTRGGPAQIDDAAVLLADVGAVRTLAFFGDASFDVRLDVVDRRGGAGVTMRGVVVNDKERPTEGRFVLAYEQGMVVAAVWSAEGDVYELRPQADGSHRARELNSSGFEPCGTTAEHEVGPGIGDRANAPSQGRQQGEGQQGEVGLAGDPSKSGCCPDDGAIIDVLVAYTPTVVAESGGTAGAIALAEAAMAATNTAYEASNVETRVRLVHAWNTQESESGDFGDDLGRFRSIGEGFFDGVHALREQHDADMVAMLGEWSGVCGVAYLMRDLTTDFASSAFSLTDMDCAVGNLTFAHELGHNQGCHHDRDNAGGALFSYSYGHRWFGTNGVQYRSVMAYSPGSRVPRLSNPGVLFQGTATGVANIADNTRSLNDAAPTVALFRDSNSGGSCPGDLADASGFGPPDGTVGFGDFFALSFLTGPCGEGTVNADCVGDLADTSGFGALDGQVDFGDFFAMSFLTGPCE